MPFLSQQAEEVLQSRYYDRDPITGVALENWEGLCKRVSRHIAHIETRYGNDPRKWEEEFFTSLHEMDLMPNTPCLMNAGSRGGLGLLSACFVQIPGDDLTDIMTHLGHSALLFKSGAGVGYNFSHLRGSNEMVRSSMRPSSGALSYVQLFNALGDTVKQGGRRRAAMMGLLSDSHPEIENFINFKNTDQTLTNFNISILASDAFMQAIEMGGDWDLKNRIDGSAYKTVSAEDLYKKMIHNNLNMAEPGMIWLDNINRHNPVLKTLGPIECVNPCGEATLYDYENCCLASVNLMNHLSDGQVDWERLAHTVRIGVRFLDNVVDANVHVSPEFEKASLATRRIGLGVTGFADLLVHLDSVYGSESSLSIATEIATFINGVATVASQELALEKGPYPAWDGSWHQAAGLMLRNVSLLSIAPEGSRSLIAGVSPSIEPNFGRTIVRTNRGIGSGTFTHPLADNPAFVTTYEVPLEGHIKMQAAWQDAMNANMVAQSISKTCNAPANIKDDELAEAYLEAWRLGLKGLTTYVDGSRDAVFHEEREEEQRDEHGRVIQDCATGVCDVGLAK